MLKIIKIKAIYFIHDTPCKMSSFIKKIRIIWILILLAVVIYLSWMKIVPGGKISYSYDLKGYNGFISRLSPSDRVENGNKIIGDPAYFSLSVPRRFEKAHLTVEFKNESDRPIIEAGVLADKRVWSYDLKPIQNRFLDELFDSWHSLVDDDLVLFQRNEEYSSVKDFLKDSPPYEKVATYDYDFKHDFVLDDYRPTTTAVQLCRPIEGAYQFYTYIKDEDLSFNFAFRDLNENSDPDPINILVYYNDKEIYSEALEDNGRGSGDMNYKLHLKSLPEGAYKIGIRANSDIVTRSIWTTQRKVSFINKVVLAAAPEVSCGRNLFTNSHKIQFMTILADRLGVANVRRVSGAPFSENVDIAETYKQYETKKELPPFSEVVMPSDGITVSGDGLFSFSSDQYFDPRIKKAGEGFDPDKEGVDFIIARYNLPQKNGNWTVASADFDLANAYKEKGKHSFLISVPGLRAEDGSGQGVVIKNIKVDLEGVSLLEKIKRIFKRS